MKSVQTINEKIWLVWRHYIVLMEAYTTRRSLMSSQILFLCLPCTNHALTWLLYEYEYVCLRYLHQVGNVFIFVYL